MWWYQNGHSYAEGHEMLKRIFLKHTFHNLQSSQCRKILQLYWLSGKTVRNFNFQCLQILADSSHLAYWHPNSHLAFCPRKQRLPHHHKVALVHVFSWKRPHHIYEQATERRDFFCLVMLWLAAQWLVSSQGEVVHFAQPTSSQYWGKYGLIVGLVLNLGDIY